MKRRNNRMRRKSRRRNNRKKRKTTYKLRRGGLRLEKKENNGANFTAEVKQKQKRSNFHLSHDLKHALDMSEL